MNSYLEKLTHLISNCAMDNTYKMSWARAITEHLVTNTKDQFIHFDDLSPSFLNTIGIRLFSLI